MKRRGDVYREVAAAVIDLGRCTVSDLTPLFPNLTRQEVQNALSAARRAGLVLVLQRIPTPGNSARMGIWGPTTEEIAKTAKPRQARAITSVFDMATGSVAIPAWKLPARACRPLGAWD